MTGGADAGPQSEPDAPPEPPDVTSAALTGITRGREAAKWLVGALAAVAAILVAGTQLSSIGEAAGLRLAIAAVCAVTGLGLLGVALFATFRLMAPISLSLDELARRTRAGKRRDSAVRFLHDNPSVFLGEAADASDLEKKRKGAEMAQTAALASYRKTPSDSSLKDALVAADARLQHLDSVAASVTAYGTYAEFTGRMRGWERLMAVALVVVGLALVGFAWAANPPEDADADAGGETGVNLRGITLEDVDLSRTDLGGIDFSYATLIRVDLSGAATDGATWEGVTWEDVTCVDGRNSDDVGGTCSGHLGSD